MQAKGDATAKKRAARACGIVQNPGFMFGNAAISAPELKSYNFPSFKLGKGFAPWLLAFRPHCEPEEWLSRPVEMSDMLSYVNLIDKSRE